MNSKPIMKDLGPDIAEVQKAQGDLRSKLLQEIKKFVLKHSKMDDKIKELVLRFDTDAQQEIDSFPQLLVETDRHCGEYGWEYIDNINIGGQTDILWFETASNIVSQHELGIDDLINIYELFQFLEEPDNKDTAIEDGKVIIKEN